MAFIPIPNTAEVAIRFLQDGQNVANVWHVAYDGFPSEETMLLIASKTILWWQEFPRPITSNTVTLLEVSVVDQSELSGVAALLAPTSDSQGGNASPQLPNATTVAVKKATGLAGRSFRGRLYHVGLTEEQVTANRITAAIQTSINAAYNALVGEYNEINCQWVVASLYTNNAPRTTGVTTPIIGVSTDPVIDSQRRRLPGRGR